MGLKITGMALKNLVSKPVTKLYPVEPQEYTSATRGHIHNDMEKCILCGICMKKCPTSAITVDKEARTWSINPYSCVQCEACIRACPPKSKSLSMLPDYTPAVTSMTVTTLTKPEEEDSGEKEEQAGQEE